MLKRFLLILHFLITVSALGQSQLTGQITTDAGETLPGASVIITDNADNFVTYGITGEDGTYSLSVDEPGDYKLLVNFLGFEKQSFKITVAAGRNMLQKIILTESQEMLREVVIDAEAPVRREGDTLVYDAGKLATGHEVVVEDLLKNIPGITVQQDGKIYYGDMEIEKVMVDGDDLFNKGYTLLTRNMPTRPLHKIEVLQNYSNNKLLKGIENSNGVALNLTIDEKFRNIWFGDITLAYGNDNRYDTGGNLMNFSKSYKNFLTANFNNAGYDKVGAINDMIYNSNELESIEGTTAAALMDLAFAVPRLESSLSRFNNVKMASLSTVVPLSEKIKLTVKGFLGFDRLNNWNSSYSVVNVPGTYFENFQSNSAENDLRKTYVNAYLNYDISANQMLQSSTTFNSGNSDFRNDLDFNGVNTREALSTRSIYLDQRVTYTQQWKGRNVVLLKGRFLSDRLPQQYGINDYLLGDLFSYENITAIGNDIGNEKKYAGVEADFKFKQQNDNLVAFKIGYTSTRENLRTQFSLFTDSTAFFPENFQAASGITVGDLYLSSGYTWALNKLSLTANLNAHQLFNKFDSKNSANDQQPFFINPNLFANYKFNPQHQLSASYSYNFTNTTLLQVNDTYLLASSRSFVSGLGYFEQLENSFLKVIYAAKHYLDRYSFSLDLDYARQHDALRYRRQLEQNSALSQAFIMQGGETMGVGMNSHFVVKKLKGSVKVTAKAGKIVYYNVINDSGLRKNIAYNQNYILNWRSDFNGNFDFSLGTEWNFNKTVSEMIFRNITKVSFADLLYKNGDNFLMKMGIQHYNFGGIDRENNYFFSDFESSYSFKDKKYTIGLDARNLFNTKTFTTYSISDYGFSTTSYRLLPRYVLMSFKVRF